MKKLVLLAGIWSLVADAQNLPRDLTEATLKELMNIEVTSVSKKEQKLLTAPAAIYVITQEAIRRSGLTTIPEILRMAPGLDVARIAGNKWAVSSRGFNAQFSNKMLVLLDGRSIYRASNSGVYWNEHEMMVEDIDRIEVIRGPGATLWGANAVNGVINIITRSAADTQGSLVTASEGNEDRAVASARYGGTVGKLGAYRFYSKYARRADLPGSDNKRDSDGVTKFSGFRSDWNFSGRDALTVQGSLFSESLGVSVKIPILTPPYQQYLENTNTSTGGNLVANWRHRASDRSAFTVSGYFDSSQVKADVLGESRRSFNLDFQHSWTGVPRHDIVWGLGFRRNGSSFSNSHTVRFLPAQRNERLYSAFVQDEFHWVRDKLSVIAGSKFEQNAFTGAEVQPSIRLAWRPSWRRTVWAGVSRAVRTPSYFDEGAQLVFAVFPTASGLPGELRSFGFPAGVSEVLRVHEVGYRSQLNRFSVDWTGFYNVYHNLRTYDPARPFATADPQPLHLVLPLIRKNSMRGESEGMEVTQTWEAASRWRISTSYSWLNLQLHLDPSSGDTSSERQERQSPRHQVQFRSAFDLNRHVQFDTSVYYVGSLPALSVPAYTRIDARLGWRLSPTIEINVGGQNLQGGRHLEYVSEGPFAASRVGRSFYGRVAWRSE